jgi:hypothetical protein
MSAQFFNDLDIDPFEIIGVSRNCDKKTLKKAYLKQALIYHPDKKNGCETEFKLLVECYKYICNCLDGKIKSNKISSPDINATNYKGNFKDTEDINYTRTNLNYNNQDTRKMAFVDHGLPSNTSDSQDNLDSIFGSRKNIKKKYNPTEYINEQINIFENEKFHNGKFNAAFELHKDQYGCNSAYLEEEFEEPLGFESQTSMSPLEILTYKGLIIDKPQKDIKLKHREAPKKQMKINKLKGNSEYKKKLHSQKIDSKISQNQMKKMVNNARPEIKINSNLTFDQANELFYQEKVKQMKLDMESNKEIVEQYTGIYEPAYIEMYKQNLIQDSSTMIFPNTDPYFKSNKPINLLSERPSSSSKINKLSNTLDRQFQNVSNLHYF